MFVAARKRKEQAESRRLRQERGWSLRRIASELGVAVSSVSVWVRNVELTPAQRAALAPTRRAPRSRAAALSAEDDRVRKRCGRCRRDLPLSAFNRAGEGRQHWCRECFRNYFARRGDLHRAQSGAALARRRARARRHVAGVLAQRRCGDCGIDDPVVLEFDHVRGKTCAIAELIASGARPATVDEEISRCDVVCCNCHRRRTARRSRWLRLEWDSERAARLSSTQRRNVRHLLSWLRSHPCVDCGEDDIVVLDFDHVGVKQANVTRMAWDERSLQRIDHEIAQCQVRCANCHRRKTAERGGHYRYAALDCDDDEAPVA
jgi:hypothetical protein